MVCSPAADKSQVYLSKMYETLTTWNSDFIHPVKSKCGSINVNDEAVSMNHEPKNKISLATHKKYLFIVSVNQRTS